MYSLRHDNLRYDFVMAQRFWTAEELSQLSPAEQGAIFEASLVTDLAEVPPEFLSQIRDRFEQRARGADAPRPLGEFTAACSWDRVCWLQVSP